MVLIQVILFLTLVLVVEAEVVENQAFNHLVHLALLVLLI